MSRQRNPTMPLIPFLLMIGVFAACPAKDGFEDTTDGAVATIKCPQGYSGQKSRLCDTGIWTEIRDECVRDCDWQPAAWSQCTEQCGGGTMERTLFSPNCPPLRSVLKCNNHACTKSVMEGAWGPLGIVVPLAFLCLNAVLVAVAQGIWWMMQQVQKVFPGCGGCVCSRELQRQVEQTDYWKAKAEAMEVNAPAPAPAPAPAHARIAQDDAEHSEDDAVSAPNAQPAPTQTVVNELSKSLEKMKKNAEEKEAALTKSMEEMKKNAEEKEAALTKSMEEKDVVIAQLRGVVAAVPNPAQEDDTKSAPEDDVAAASEDEVRGVVEPDTEG